MEKEDKKKEGRFVPIKITHEMWVKLRRMQEQGLIKSIQKAGVRGLELLIESMEKER